MNAASPTRHRALLALAEELRDAHLDTIELMLGQPGELRWRAQLDYLSALVRKAEEILAAGCGVKEAVEFAAAARPRSKEAS
jgi:hypothetical protein